MDYKLDCQNPFGVLSTLDLFYSSNNIVIKIVLVYFCYVRRTLQCKRETFNVLQLLLPSTFNSFVFPTVSR